MDKRNSQAPFDDGACDHLKKAKLPNVELMATNGKGVNLSAFELVVIYLYPMTGRPDLKPPDGWAEIPGAKGCTPQSCSFRDHYQELQSLGAEVFGLSTQDSDYQREAKNRLHLPFELLSDKHQQFIEALSIPTLEVEGKVLAKRITLIAAHGQIEKVFYPVFPAEENAEQVVQYLQQRK